ncbi:MAG: IS110 family transposase [Actinomycetota bacterium]|nr:IS110 family transposase [Actinomycetota bacterium]MDQ3639988.1 IS110 family transposase [Actinomycetota bacterium]
MFVIGVDPHKGSHTAAALSSTEEVIADVGVDADTKQLERLLEWAEAFSPRRWAVEGAGGTGALLARQLVAAGEEVVDVPPTLSARVRLLDRGRSAKTDAHDARATAIVALRHTNLRRVTAPADVERKRQCIEHLAQLDQLSVEAAQLGQLQRHGSHRRLQRRNQAPPSQPEGEPPAQPRPSRSGGDPGGS